MEEYAVHRTTTGKVFELTDLKGNPLKYDDYKDNFTRKYLRMLDIEIRHTWDYVKTSAVNLCLDHSQKYIIIRIRRYLLWKSQLFLIA